MDRCVVTEIHLNLQSEEIPCIWNNPFQNREYRSSLYRRAENGLFLYTLISCFYWILEETANYPVYLVFINNDSTEFENCISDTSSIFSLPALCSSSLNSESNSSRRISSLYIFESALEFPISIIAESRKLSNNPINCSQNLKSGYWIPPSQNLCSYYLSSGMRMRQLHSYAFSFHERFQL